MIKHPKVFNVYSKINKTHDLLLSLDLKDNLFSIRGKLIFINTQEKEMIIKICPSSKSKNKKNKSFKLLVKGEISMKYINSFVSLEVIRIENGLFMEKFELIEAKSN